MSDDVDTMAKTAAERVKAIAPLLAGLHRGVQGAVLADLTAMWVAGHYQAGTRALEELLDMHIEKVHELVPVNIQIIKGRGG